MLNNLTKDVSVKEVEKEALIMYWLAYNCKAQPQLKPNCAELDLIPIPPTADPQADRPANHLESYFLVPIDKYC